MKETPSQTAGPYIHIGCTPSVAGLERYSAELGTQVTGTPPGERIILDLMIYDGAGEPIKDALVEIWHVGSSEDLAPSVGRRNWSRQATDLKTGAVRFETPRPQAGDGEAPHVLVWIVARGINLGLTTRVYFDDQHDAGDPVLQAAGDRAGTLIARRGGDGYLHEIHLQGDKETVFLDV